MRVTLRRRAPLWRQWTVTRPISRGRVVADRYRLIRELGRGGMGVVWEARSLALEVNVALKLLGTRGAESEAASRMAREAQAAARLAHPALVRVYDFGWSSRGNPFLVMELVNGETLASAISQEGRIAPIRAVQILLPIADGLPSRHQARERTDRHRRVRSFSAKAPGFRDRASETAVERASADPGGRGDGQSRLYVARASARRRRRR